MASLGRSGASMVVAESPVSLAPVASFELASGRQRDCAEQFGALGLLSHAATAATTPIEGPSRKRNRRDALFKGASDATWVGSVALAESIARNLGTLFFKCGQKRRRL
jgi:hypothetical protein